MNTHRDVSSVLHTYDVSDHWLNGSGRKVITGFLQSKLLWDSQYVQFINVNEIALLTFKS